MVDVANVMDRSPSLLSFKSWKTFEKKIMARTISSTIARRMLVAVAKITCPSFTSVPSESTKSAAQIIKAKMEMIPQKTNKFVARIFVTIWIVGIVIKCHLPDSGKRH